jgi:hypothetical protein
MIAIAEKIDSKPTDEAAAGNRYSLTGLEVDDASSSQLLEMRRCHCKLALEHGRAHTTVDLRQEIIG